MSNKDIPAWCRKAVDSIMHDLSDRRGIRSVLDTIDEDVIRYSCSPEENLVVRDLCVGIAAKPAELNKQTGGGA